MKPEDKARKKIDELLEKAGWMVQDYRTMNIRKSLGVAVHDFPLTGGEADYLLFVEGKAAGVVEAKPEGTTLSGVEPQSAKYLTGIPDGVSCVQKPLPFAYESTGTETRFRDLRDPDPRSRRVFAFHQPAIVKKWLSQQDTLRSRLKNPPPLVTEGLRDCQIDAITGLERSLKGERPRALIQMASGGGKTFAAITVAYRLIKLAKAERILFLVDRSTLGKQTRQEFQLYSAPLDGRKFTELYNIQRLTSNVLDPVNRVCISTIQRMYSMLRGEPELEGEVEEESLFETPPLDEKPKEVSYNPQIPIETFDFIIVDECHRSIYDVWRQVLEYFDAFIIGLTATPSKQTLGFFDQNLVSEYSHERAVADGVNVGYDVYRIDTEITQEGSEIKAGYYVDKRDKDTRRIRWEKLDEDLSYTPKQLDRDVVAKNQIRTVVRTFKENVFTEIFPGRTRVPKTLIFAKDDSHAEDIVEIVREEFEKGNEFCKKITYKSYEKTDNLISDFRNSYFPRIAVTVDMISTGADIRPLECLLFMRGVKSRIYFDQMKGRGTRTILPDDLRGVTPDAAYKTHFVIVDAVGVCENDKSDSRPLERKRSVPFDKLIQSIHLGKRDKDTITSLANRLSRLDRAIEDTDRKEIEDMSGFPLKEIINKLFDAVDPDKQMEKAQEMFHTETPSKEEVEKATEELVNESCNIFDNPHLRNTIIEIKERSEQIIDRISQDTVLFSGFDDGAKERARTIVDTFEQFIEENKDELTALQLIYGKPYKERRITFEEIKKLAEAIEKPPYNLTPEGLWQAYEQLEQSKVRRAGPKKLLTDIISLIRFAVGEDDVLEPFSESVDRRFETWLEEQRRMGKEFTGEQMEWLNMIKEHITASLGITVDDFGYTPFYEKGGAYKAYGVFGQELDSVLEELNEVLVA